MEIRNVTRGKWRLKLFQITFCIGVKLDQLTFEYFTWVNEIAELKKEHQNYSPKTDPGFKDAKSYVAKPKRNYRRER